MYLDPSFGGMIIQVVIAIAATGGALLFAFRKKISKLFSKNKKLSASERPAAHEEEEIESDVIDSITNE